MGNKALTSIFDCWNSAPCWSGSLQVAHVPSNAGSREWANSSCWAANSIPPAGVWPVPSQASLLAAEDCQPVQLACTVHSPSQEWQCQSPSSLQMQFQKHEKLVPASKLQSISKKCFLNTTIIPTAQRTCRTTGTVAQSLAAGAIDGFNEGHHQMNFRFHCCCQNFGILGTGWNSV